jgi:hypothetical protein
MSSRANPASADRPGKDAPIQRVGESREEYELGPSAKRRHEEQARDRDGNGAQHPEAGRWGRAAIERVEECAHLVPIRFFEESAALRQHASGRAFHDAFTISKALGYNNLQNAF